MSDALFPSSLPGVVFDGRTTYYGDEVQEGDSGMEYRLNRYTAPRYRYAYGVEFLRASQNEIAQLHGFFVAHGGRRESFLLVDPVDGITRRVRFNDPELELTPFVRGGASVLSGSLELVTVVG